MVDPLYSLFLPVVCRDQACDIRIVNKEVSRRHLEVYVNQDGNVCIRSLGREPVLLNGEQVLSSKVLQTKDTIEVLLEGRTREFHFQGVSRVEKVDGRSPLAASSVINRIPEEEGEEEDLHQVYDMADAVDHGGKEEEEEKKAEEEEKEDMMPGAGQEHVDAPAPMEEEMDAVKKAAEEEKIDAPQPMEEVVDAEEEEAHPVEVERPCDDDMGVISGMVSHMVQKIFERVIIAAENAAQTMTPNVGKSKRKSVRFVAGTPEGQACDATLTIRCVPKGDQSVLVEDDTVAFSKWGFGTMGKDEMDEEANVETVLSKHSKKESLGAQDTPGSVKHVHAKSTTPMQRSSKLDFDGTGVENTPGCQQTGAQAPTSTPVTAAKHGVTKDVKTEMDFNALATKLGEIAEDHDVQFELPAGFMRFTPMSTTKSKRKSSDGAQNMSKRLSMSSTSEEGDVKFDLPKDFMRFTPMSAPAKNNQGKDQEESSVEFDLPKGFMRFTPLTEPKRRKSMKSTNESMEDVEYELPKGFMRFTPMASTKKGSSSTNGMAYDLPKDFMRFTPLTVASKKSKTPSEKIDYELPEDFLRWTPAAKSAVKALKNLEKSMSEIGDIHEATEDGAEEIATLRSVGHAVHELADAMDRVASVKKSAQKTPGVRIAIVEKGSSFKTDNPQVRLVFGADADSIPEETAEEILPADKVVTKKASHSAHGLRTVMVQAKAFRSQALVLGKHLRRSTKRFAKMRATARILSSKYKAEKAKRVELQNTLKELIKVREDQERDFPSEGEEEEAPMEEESRVIVVGHRPSMPSTNVELTGSVVVVRPQAAAPEIVTPETVKINKRPPRSVRTLTKSVRRVSNGNEMQVFLDDIKMPKWIYDNEGEEEERDLEKDMDEDVQNDEVPPLEEHEEPRSEDETESTPEDICHICKTGNDGDILLLCDSCDNACHLHCCKPVRKRVPKGDWFCRDCKEAKKAANDAPTQTTQKGNKRKATGDDSKSAPKKAKENAPKKATRGKKPLSSATEAPQTRTRRTRSTTRV